MYRRTQERRNGTGSGGDTLATEGGAVFSEGDFIALVEHYSDDLRGFFRRRGVGSTDCEDRAQECFEVLWRKRSDVDPARAKHYLFGIALNVMTGHWRKQMRDMALSDVQTFSEVVAAPRADKGMELAEGLQRLNGLLATLPQRQREVLELMHGRDLSTAEAARRLGISRGTVINHHARALKALAVLDAIPKARRKLISRVSPLFITLCEFDKE